jgi:carbamoyltransferase
MHKSNRPSRSNLNVVGISAGYHDSACGLLVDGIVVAAAQEERFSRVKNDKSFPRRALRYCLEEAGLTISDVDCVSFYEDTNLKLNRQIWTGLTVHADAEQMGRIINRCLETSPQEVIRSVLGYRGRIEIVDHHLSHAASSYCFSGFDEAAILTIDGVGDWPTTTYNSGSCSGITRFEQVEFPHSLGFFYSAITSYLGFEVNEGEYKVMGLAPYGVPKYVDKLWNLIVVGSGGQYRLNLDYFSFLTSHSMYSQALVALLGEPPRTPESQLLQFHMDVAKSAQIVLESVLLEKVRYLHSRVPSENLCLGGGVALNVVANSRCLREGPFKNLFVQPAAGDAGSALGAAAVAHHRLAGKLPNRRLTHAYLGPSNPVDEVRQLFSRSSANYWDCFGDEQALIERSVSLLLKGAVIGWCQGRMEFGPRALGARSILADPRDPGMRTRVNSLVKMREMFRPFAPAVLESECSQHFDLNHASPFMLETCQVTSAVGMPAVTHVDGSARVQTVDCQSHRRFAALLTEFGRRTSCSVLLNTSFNIRGEPIVCSSFDAVACFIKSRLDALVIEDCIIERSGIPDLWQLYPQFRARQTAFEMCDSKSTVDHLVYTLF